MNLEKRISDLERLQGIDDRTLEGVLYFHEENVVVDGKRYESINDIPSETVEKYGKQFVGLNK